MEYTLSSGGGDYFIAALCGKIERITDGTIYIER